MLSDGDIRVLFETMGLCIVEEACVFQYQDAPSSFVSNAYWDTMLVDLGDGELVDVLFYNIELASALWKGELMFFDGANLAFGCGTNVMTSDFCCN